VLHCIVKDDEVDVGIDAQEAPDSLAPVLTHRHSDHRAELAVNLVRLITQVNRRDIVGSHHKALSATLVATAKHSNIILAAEP